MDDKLVLITSFHSSSFMRISKLSFVMPALLTKIVGAPKLSLISANNAFIESSWVTSSTSAFPA